MCVKIVLSSSKLHLNSVYCKRYYDTLYDMPDSYHRSANRF